MQNPNEGTVLLEDAHLIFRNFSGRATDYNSQGDRNFCVLLGPLQAQEMRQVGWNVKQLKPREEGDTPQDYVQIKVSYGKGRPPRCILVTSRGRNDLGADEIDVLDVVDIKKAELIIRPYHWEVNGNTGVKAYLKTLVVTLNEDELELRYADVLEDLRNEDASDDES